MRLFVYGTLLLAQNHPLGDVLRDNATLIGRGSIRARLHIIPDPQTGADAYPGATRGRRAVDRVHGELYLLRDDFAELLKVLDAYENCSPEFPEPHEFQRRRVKVELADRTVVDAVAYLYNWDIAKARLVPDGQFLSVGSVSVSSLRPLAGPAGFALPRTRLRLD